MMISDFRLHNPNTDGMSCYCPPWLRKFSSLAGGELFREEIQQEAQQEGAPTKFRV